MKNALKIGVFKMSPISVKHQRANYGHIICTSLGNNISLHLYSLSDVQ